MAKKKKQKEEAALVAVQPTEVTVLPPDSGVVGEFLFIRRIYENKFKCFKALILGSDINIINAHWIR